MSEVVRTVGVVSDTHGRLRPELFELFADVDLVLHAGDVGDPAILDDLEAVAPVRAVWGNVDGWEVRSATEEQVEVEVAGVRIAVIHGHQDQDYGALPARFPGAAVVVHGHSHVPKEEWRDGVLILNPGSAGPRRFGKPVTAALLRVGDGRIRVRFEDLAEGGEWSGDHQRT